MTNVEHQLKIALDVPNRRRLEVIRTFLTLNHPEGGVCSMHDAFVFLLEHAPVQEMAMYIQGAMQPSEELVYVEQLAESEQQRIASFDSTPRVEPTKRPRGRPKK